MSESNAVLNEITKLGGRLDAQSERLTARLDAQDEQLDSIRKDIKANTHLMTGNGSPDRGMIVRLDRIEQAGKRRDTLVKLLIGAVVSGLVATVFALVKAHLILHP